MNDLILIVNDISKISKLIQLPETYLENSLRSIRIFTLVLQFLLHSLG
jgi:hypothetical protein